MGRLIVGVLLLLVIQAVPAISEAATSVTVGLTVLPDAASGPMTTINGKPSIRLVNADGTARDYVSATGGTFRISTCRREPPENCSGNLPARVFVDDLASSDKIVLTDATILNTGTTQAILTIQFSSNDFTNPTPLAAGDYPYFVFLNGIFVAPTGANPRNNSINVSAFTGNSSEIESGQVNTGFPPDPGPSLQAPSFKTTVTADFNKQETENQSCGIDQCANSLTTTVNVTLLGQHKVHLPGSTGGGGANVTVENGGLVVVAQEFASLHPRPNTPVLGVSLEPSPGDTDDNVATPEFLVRGVGNSQTGWVSARSAGVSLTSAFISIDSAVKVIARRLCPVTVSNGSYPGQAGCQELDVDVSVFCSDDTDPVVDAPGALKLDQHGNGHASLLVALPCLDPAVLIREPSQNFLLDPDRPWIAAPGMF